MKIKFENLGPLKEGELDFNDIKNINIIIGANNSGKTYLNYLIYTGFKVMKNFFLRKSFRKLNIGERSFTKELIEKRNIKLTESDFNEIMNLLEKDFKDEFKRELSKTFHVSRNFFKNFKMEISLEEEIRILKKTKTNIIGFDSSIGIIEIKKNMEEISLDIIDIDEKVNFRNFDEMEKIIDRYGLKYSNVKFIIRHIGEKKSSKDIGRSVRTAIEAMFGELFNKKNRIFSLPAERSGAALFYKQLLENRSNTLRWMEENEISLENKKGISRYSEPVNDYILFLNSISEEGITKTELYSKISDKMTDLIGGEIILKDRDVFFKDKIGHLLDMGVVSSTVKSLTGFFLYLKHKAKKGDIVIIDEPELNLHPENQRNLVRIFNILSSYGIKFVLSTHSPIITQEINNMILFENKKKAGENLENIVKEYNLNKEKYGLEKDNINIWFINEEKLEKLNPDEIGFNTDTFNEVIGDMNNLYQDLFYN